MSSILGVVSPHLDDAVISCSGLLARHPGSHVVTVFAEGPGSVDPLPDWDHMAGFEVGSDVALTRRKEDAQAAELLKFQAHYLRWWESNYRYASRGYEGPSQDGQLVRTIASELVAAMSALTVDDWVVPLGLENKDHELVASACADALIKMGCRRWFIYEELPNYISHPAAQRQQLTDRWRLHGRLTHYQPGPGEVYYPSRPAIECYASQLRALGLDWLGNALATPESYLQLVVPTSR